MAENIFNLNNLKKKIIYISLVTGLAIAGYGYYQLTKGITHLKSESAAYSISAIGLMDLFETDMTSVNEKFVDKIIAINGNVSRMDTTHGTVFIFFEHPLKKSSIKCQMDGIYKSDYLTLHAGSTLTIKGILVGGEVLDFDLGTDISMKRCAIDNNN